LITETDNDGNKIKKATRHENVFELPWNAKEVKKLLDSSFVPYKQLYVGIAGLMSGYPIHDHPYTIQNQEDFINGSFDDLMDLSKLGEERRDIHHLD
jgi:hypothetical protein